MIRRLVILIMIIGVGMISGARTPLTPSQSSTDWDQEYVKTLFDGRQLAPVEGVWQFGTHGAVVAIIKSNINKTTGQMPVMQEQPSGDYQIYLIDSPRLSVEPGLLIGSANATPRANVYDVRLENNKLGKQSNIKSQTLTFTVNPGGTLTAKPYKTGYTLSIRRWFSYLFRLTVIDNTNDRPEGLDGARRLYPFTLSENYPISL